MSKFFRMSALLPVVLALPLLFSSCTKESPESLIVGDWRVTKGVLTYSDGDQYTHLYSGSEMVFSFESDGTGSLYTSSKGTFTYKIAGNTLITTGGGSVVKFEISELTENSLVLILYDDEDEEYESLTYYMEKM